MPSTPHIKEEMLKGTAKRSDSDVDDSDQEIPPLLPFTSDEEDLDDDEGYSRKPTTKAKGKGKDASKTPKSDVECADMWYKLKKDEKEKHIHVMKVYLLSPFLFGSVHQDDKWIRWAYESGLLPSKSCFETKELDEKYFDAVDLIETAFNKLAENALWKYKDGLVKTLNLIGSPGVNMSQHLDKAVTCAESFLDFTNLRDKIKLKPGTTKKQRDVALLLAHNQVTDHIKQLAAGDDLMQKFQQKCKKEETGTVDRKNEGNDEFAKGRYTAAISVYTNALHLSPYNHLLYGNRAQSYLKTNELRCALTDGRRAVVLKPDWHKAQYRYAQAFYELGDITRAKETNRAATKICSEKKDLDTQFERFEKAIQATKDAKGKARENKKASKQSILLEDLPDLVDASSSDTSGNSDYDGGVPELLELDDATDSMSGESEDPISDSADEEESDDSSARKKITTAPQRKKKRPNKKVRQVLRENMQDKLRQEKKAKKEKQEKKIAEIAEEKENKKLEERTKETKATQVAQSHGNSQRKKEFAVLVKQGSKAILEKKCVMAVRYYGEAVTILAQCDLQYQLFDLKEIDFVILLYGFGAAYLELGSHEELREAKKQFDIIVVEHKHVVFPLAYLGTGRVFYKQNRFTEALEPLEEGLALVNKLGDDLASYRWPGSQVIIDETKPGKLQSAIETLIRICRHPPRPDAVCRYHNCSNKAQIYLTDPDYKGFIRLTCNQECKVEFHPVCWKKQKSTQEGKAGDKDFLDDGCLTPDCGGAVVNIQFFDTDGLKTECKSERLNTKVETKHKPTKQNKVKASAVAPKQKKKKEKEDAKIEDTTPTDTDTTEEREPSNPPPPPPLPVSVQKEEKPSKEDHTENGKDDHFNSDSSVQEGSGVFILRKDEDEEPTKGVGKAKTRKKKPKNTQTLDEFLKDRGGQQTLRPSFGDTADDIDEMTAPKGQFDFFPPPLGWSQHEMEAPFAIPHYLQGEVAELEASFHSGMNMLPFSPLTAPQPQIDLKAVTDYVSSMLQEILRANGPLELADPNIMQPLSMLPDNYQDIISNAGGLRPILEQSGKFVFEGNRVMLPEDKDFEDLVQDYQRKTYNPFLERINGTNSDRMLENAVHDAKAIWDADSVMEPNGFVGDLHVPPSLLPLSNSLSSSSFNPDAKEFVPLSAQTLLPNSSLKTSLNSSSIAVGDAELVDDLITEKEGSTNIEECESVTEGAEEHKTVSNGLDESKVDLGDYKEQKSVLIGSNEQKPVLNGAEEQKPVSNGNDDLKPVSNGTEEFKPVSNSNEECTPFGYDSEEFRSISNGIEEEKPVSNDTEEKKPDSEIVKERAKISIGFEAGHVLKRDGNDKKSNVGTSQLSEDVSKGHDEATKAEPVTLKIKLFCDAFGSIPRVSELVEQARKSAAAEMAAEMAAQKPQPTHKRTSSNNPSEANEKSAAAEMSAQKPQPTHKRASSNNSSAASEKSAAAEMAAQKPQPTHKRASSNNSSASSEKSAAAEMAAQKPQPTHKRTGSNNSSAASDKSAAAEMAAQKPQPTHKQTGSNNSSAASEQSVITSKTKSVQTQPNVKHKGVGTDPIPEPFKAEYHRILAEKDSLQARLQENTERHNALLNKNTSEVEKVRKKLSDALQEKEKFTKEMQEIKQKNLEEIRKLRQQCEDKEEKIKTLNQKMLQSADDKSSAVNNLKKELVTCKGQFASEKDSWNKERSEKEEMLKNMKLQHQQQQARAQEAEIKLLELRRDVGLRFLERAYQESHITINNLLQAVNARIAGPKVEELINTWKSYAAECHQRVLQCKATFNEQIDLLKTGRRTLANVTQLTIPGPPPYPAIPVLQSVVPGQQQQQQQLQPQAPPQPPLETKVQPPRASEPPLPSVSSSATATGAGPSSVAPVPVSHNAAVGGDKATIAAAAAAAVTDKGRPSNSFERIMLRLSTMYPNFTRLELTGFIKEVRHNKHGSLTGLSLEDIVSSVSELVEQKKKAGLLRPGPVPPSNPTIQRQMKPTVLPQKTQLPQAGQPFKPAVLEGPKMAPGSLGYEEDPCVICHEDMNASNDIVTLECGHRYHSQCIRKWLLGEQSTCPTCRVHALLPDEFPRLK